MIELTVPGEAVPQARPRVTRCGTYDPPKCRVYKQKVGLVAKTAMRGKEPLRGPVKMSIIVYRGIPKSWTKKKKLSAMTGGVYPTTKPDIDNLLKGIMDALKGICWGDDAQVVTVDARKVYDACARVHLKIWSGEENEHDGRTDG